MQNKRQCLVELWHMFFYYIKRLCEESEKTEWGVVSVWLLWEVSNSDLVTYEHTRDDILRKSHISAVIVVKDLYTVLMKHTISDNWKNVLIVFISTECLNIVFFC